MKHIYDIDLENRLYDLKMEQAELAYETWKLCAEQLKITIDDYCDFMVDMAFDTLNHTLPEIEQMYNDYCHQYDTAIMQVNIGKPMKLYGAI